MGYKGEGVGSETKNGLSVRILFPTDKPDGCIPGEQSHLVDGNRIGFCQPVGLQKIIADEMGVKVLHV